jgi:hypothetical protein
MTMIRVLVGAFLLTACMLAGGLIYAAVSTVPIPAASTNPLPWQIASNLVNAAVLTWIAQRSRMSGWRLAAIIGALLFGVAHFTSLVEAQFFGFFGTAQTLALLAMSFTTVLLFAPLFAWMFQESVKEEPHPPVATITPLRLVIGAAAYVFTYFLAGITIMPFIQEFYARMPMPDPLQLIAMQGLLRGPLFVILLYMVLRVTRAGRTEAIWMAGAALSIVGGIAPLIVPNPFFPDAIRWAHFVEVGISNFAYGSFVGWLLTRPLHEEHARQPANA